jgi:hypothetical protein
MNGCLSNRHEVRSLRHSGVRGSVITYFIIPVAAPGQTIALL